MTTILFVKKIKEDGSPCRKCVDVEARLVNANLMGRIARTVIADERNPESEGMKLAAEHGVDAAPFFVVTDGAGRKEVFTSYVQLLKTHLETAVSEADEGKELLERNADLDFL